MISISPGLYGIADADWGDPVRLGVALAEGGCSVVQLRAKTWPPHVLLETARTMLRLLHARNCRLIINDAVRVAAQCKADGVHLGQEDGDLSEARALLGPDAWLGRSTHTLAQVEHAQIEADYVGFGPVFSTQTKATGYTARGLSLLAEAVERSQLPVVAIGGLSLERLPEVRACGAKHWAVISAVLSAPDVTQAARRFNRIE